MAMGEDVQMAVDGDISMAMMGTTQRPRRGTFLYLLMGPSQ